ncbi:MAG: HEAT repeat domain-containing protein [Planctomycetes bacterium]|nr:HEAT repeat domain-containing protein [Planctomycetota bacterium]
MAEEAIEPLLDLLEHPEDVTRRFALWAMGHIGSAAHPATERLQAELSNDDPAMVLLAAIALSNSGAPPVESIKSFLNVLTTHDLSQPLDPWFDVCELGLKARIAPTQLLDVLAETRQLHQAVIHFACREIGVTAVGALTEFGAGAEDQMANEIALILAAISHTAGNDAFDREAARADLGLATSRLLQRAREHRKQLTIDWHAFELAATSLPESVPHGVGEQSVNGQIRDATRLLIEGMTTSRLS